ncbi:nitroreductase family protein [Desulfosporosinus meridiei]|uniref:Nitroreductase n=1 Tax=Desulfosporosinus meridiei (strain ATCC BAA-275 / DSM 13257 / KCTC 12902 / NCIMB 13706 / S10) TaxID=768704 RepID=J7IW12_DESMD|nr:nitroreductase family protein [Desulfosporosinus meridiei]AFQ46037.1 nitroreductase [Desulfosporosinus meridiei DSM 13257]
MNFLEIAQTRRSLRTYLDKPVEREKLEYVLECARLAPSWKNMQCWRFIVIDEAEGREAVAQSMGESNPGRKALMTAPLIVVLCAVPKESEVWEGKDNMMLDAGLAMEHLILAATEQGLGTCWQGLFSEETIRAALDIPDDVRVVAMTPLGYAAEERRPRPRKAMSEIVFHKKWGQA